MAQHYEGTKIEEVFQTIHCKCGKASSLLVSRNHKSTGRLYYACWSCDFFKWWDVNMVDRYSYKGKGKGCGQQATSSGARTVSLAEEMPNTIGGEGVSSNVPLGVVPNIREELTIMRTELREELKEWVIRMGVYGGLVLFVLYYVLK